MAERDDDPPDGDDREMPDSLRQRLEALVPEIVRRTFTAGMGAVFSTEEGIRKIAKEINIPDVAGYLANTADTTKDKVLEVVAREVRDFLHTVNVTDEIARLLTTLSFEVKTEIRFIPNSEKYAGVEPDVKSAVRLRRSRGDEAAERDAAGDKRGRRSRRRDDDDGDDEPADEP